MDVVSQAITDVALAELPPTIALNIVHPRPSSWSTIIGFIADALFHAGINPERLPVLPFTEWFGQLEQRADHANIEDMANIVSF